MGPVDAGPGRLLQPEPLHCVSDWAWSSDSEEVKWRCVESRGRADRTAAGVTSISQRRDGDRSGPHHDARPVFVRLFYLHVRRGRRRHVNWSWCITMALNLARTSGRVGARSVRRCDSDLHLKIPANAHSCLNTDCLPRRKSFSPCQISVGSYLSSDSIVRSLHRFHRRATTTSRPIITECSRFSSSISDWAAKMSI